MERRSSGWTAAAVVAGKKGGSGIVPLYSSRANIAAEKLLLNRIIPGLKEIRREYKIEGSRFDFLCTDNDGKRHLVEVKACSLVEQGVAMFPDAPSERALRHLEELSRFCDKGLNSTERGISHIIFLIMHGRPKVFIPNLHTDPAFAQALCKRAALCNRAALGAKAALCEKKLHIHAALIRCGEDGMAGLAEAEIPLDLSIGELAASDGGNYLVQLEIPGPGNILVEIGALGKVEFKPGSYVYTGSARKNLSSRLARHRRKERKKKHWHLDYLTPHAEKIKTLPIMTFRDLECTLAGGLEALGGEGIPGFGCSDCRCKSHLFYFPKPLAENRAFQNMLFLYRHLKFKSEN